MPPMAATGTNTAIRAREVATIGPETSRMASMVASWRHALLPSSPDTASTTTMASSTTIPMASTSPSSDSVLIEKPSRGNTMKVPISETGTVSVGNQRRAGALQEDVHHQDDQRDRLEQRDDDLADTGRDRLGGIERHHVFQVIGEALCRSRSMPRTGPASATSRPLASGSWKICSMAVGCAVEAHVVQVVLCCPARSARRRAAAPASHPGWSAPPRCRTPPGLEATAGLHRVGELGARRRRLAADLTGRHQHVLLLDGLGDVGHGQLRAWPAGPGGSRYAHGVLGDAAAQHLGQAHAADTRQLVDDVDGRVVGQEVLIVGTRWGRQRNQQQREGQFFLDRHAEALDFLGQGGLRFRDPVLGEHVGHVQVGADLERHVQAMRPSLELVEFM